MEDEELEELSFTIVNDDGLEVICDVIDTYYDEETDKLYAAFTDYTLTDDNKMKIDAREVVKTGEEYELKEIEDPEIREQLLKDALMKVA